LLSFSGIDYRYDNSGNQITSFAKGEKQQRSFNGLNQLKSININGALTHYQYDALGRRSAKITEQGRTDFIWDNNQLIGEHSKGEFTWYVYLPNAFEPIALIERNSVYYYHLDQLSTPVCITNDTGQQVWRNESDAFGYQSSDDNNELGNLSENHINNPIRFQGQYFDDESQLHYNRFRYYCPKQQRFIHQDPIGLVGGINHYQYAPNPVNWVDPFGLLCKEGQEKVAAAIKKNNIAPELSKKLVDLTLLDNTPYTADEMVGHIEAGTADDLILSGAAALAIVRVAPVQPVVNLGTSNATKVAVQVAANDSVYAAKQSLLSRALPWLAGPISIGASLLSYSPSTGGALEEFTADDGTTYSKHGDEIYFKAVASDGSKWSTDNPQQDMQFRMWKANGGEGTLEDWLSQGMPDAGELDLPHEVDLEQSISAMVLYEVAPFKLNAKGTPEEYDRQLAAQEAGINKMTIQEYLDNRKAFNDIGRKGTGKAQREARLAFENDLIEQYEEMLVSDLNLSDEELYEKAKALAKQDMETLHALHNPDMIAGGKDEVYELGNASVNSSIGSQWKHRVELMDQAAEEALKEVGPSANMNVILKRME